MKCPICQGEVSMSIRHFMVACDKPYLNIFFHLDCYKSNVENLHELINKWYNNTKIIKGNQEK